MTHIHGYPGLTELLQSNDVKGGLKQKIFYTKKERDRISQIFYFF